MDRIPPSVRMMALTKENTIIYKQHIYFIVFTNSTSVSEKIVNAPLVNTPHMTLGTVCVGYFLCIEQTCLVGRIQNLIV